MDVRLLALALLACRPDAPPVVEGRDTAVLQRAQQGENACSNDADDDADGAVDCADAECVSSNQCTGVCDFGLPAVDSDGDGYAACTIGAPMEGGDCNDLAPMVHPGTDVDGDLGFHPEIACNQIDDDCDPGTPDAVHHEDEATSDVRVGVVSGEDTCGATNEYAPSCSPDGYLVGDYVVEWTATSSGQTFLSVNAGIAAAVLTSACPTSELACGADSTVEFDAVANTTYLIVLEVVDAASCPSGGDADLDICVDEDGDTVCWDDLDANDASICADADLDGCDDCSVHGEPRTDEDGADFDVDGRCDASDPDIDGDGALNDADSNDQDARVCSDGDGDGCDDCSSGTFDPAADGADLDLDGLCDLGDSDQDGDTIDAADDPDDTNPAVCGSHESPSPDACDDCGITLDHADVYNDGADFDGDGLCDLSDPDLDDDGALNDADSNDQDARVCSDSDGDGCDDCSSGTFDLAADGADLDHDGVCDLGDSDQDGDTIDAADDPDDRDPAVCGSHEVPIPDSCDDCEVTGTHADSSDDGDDFDGDDLCDASDPDIDDDGALNDDDSDDRDASACSDGDHDGCDDCSSGTFDLATDGADLDGDGVCDLGDSDQDGDTIDAADDPDDRNPAVCGSHEVPNPDSCDDCGVTQDRAEPANDGSDADADGLCDASDDDDDNDEVLDDVDDDPFDPTVCHDTDGDGCDDCALDGVSSPGHDGVDVDSDGYCAVGDCNDGDPLEFPGQSWYADCDGDGFYRDTEPVQACNAAEAALSPTPCAGASFGRVPVPPDCDDIDPVEFPGQVWYADCDGDGAFIGTAVPGCTQGDADATDPCGTGASPTGGWAHVGPVTADCDDANAARTPGTPELCEEPIGSVQVDSDCDGNVNTEGGAPLIVGDPDHNERTFYVDADLDGYGDPAAQQGGCEASPGLAINGTDCDDVRPDVHVGADEICDGTDQNCNSLVDEADFLAEEDSLCLDLFRDRDGDGYGDQGATKCLCVDPASPTLTAVYDGEIYVATYSDCDDLHASIRPHDCNDGSDNDLDGLVDGNDDDCRPVIVAGRTRQPTSEQDDAALGPFVEETLDGHDADCDGLVPAIELDCDDDGSFPQLPIPQASAFFDAADVGLADCNGGPLQLPCWDDTLTLECDAVTKLWAVRYSSSTDGFGGRFSGGYRNLTTTACDTLGDCDDHCALRCPGQLEVCDGVDDDCGGVNYGPDDDGLPDPLDLAVAVAGNVSASELDLDGDAFADCTESFRPEADQLQAGIASCEPFGETTGTSDCDDLCYYANDLAAEACNGFLDVCSAGASLREGRDADGDGRSTCGAGTDAADTYEEHAFLPVWVACDDPSRDGCAGVVPATDGAVAQALVPLVPPRARSEVCDDALASAQAALLARVGVEPSEVATSAGLVGALCGGGAGGTCSVVRIRIEPDPGDLLDVAKAVEETGGIPAGCAERREEYTVRTVWSHERLLDARTGVVELECRRLFGLPCDELTDDDPAVATGAPPEIDDLLVDEDLWWAELGRFHPVGSGGAVMGCWGDPRTTELADETGGDCHDGSDDANRDQPEGPHDLVYAWEGVAGDCGRCTDGVDNNCDGLTDCADPTCDVCFVGQGRGCSGLRDACADGDGGCATSGAAEGGLVILAVPLLLIRRRRVRS